MSPATALRWVTIYLRIPEGLTEVLASPGSELELVELGILVEEIWHLNECIQNIGGLLRDQWPEVPAWENITSIKGTGNTGASILLSTIGTILDFADEAKLAACFGGLPRLIHSNETQRSGRITEQDRKLERTALVRCALIATRYSSYHYTYDRGSSRVGTQARRSWRWSGSSSASSKNAEE